MCTRTTSRVWLHSPLFFSAFVVLPMKSSSAATILSTGQQQASQLRLGTREK